MTKSEFIACFERNVNEIENELRSLQLRTRRHDDCVFVWPKFWLGAKFNGDVCRAVSVAQATRVNARDRRVFTNGHGEQAILMDRETALCGALKNAREILAKAHNYQIA